VELFNCIIKKKIIEQVQSNDTTTTGVDWNTKPPLS